MKPQYYFPLGIIAQSLLASAVYAWQRDWRHAVYFFAGAVITASATF